MVSEEKIFKNRPIRNNELPVVAMFVNGSGQNVQSLERTFYASYQVSVHLAERFQRRRLKCEKLTDDRRKSSHCLLQGELKRNVIFSVYCPVLCDLRSKKKKICLLFSIV